MASARLLTSTQTQKHKVGKLGRSIWRERASYALILPILILYSIFSIWPIVQTGVLSFFDAKIVRWGPFVGLDNYADLLADPRFWQAFVNTTLFTALSIVITLTIALPLSVLVNRPNQRFRTGFKVIFFLPVVTSAVAAGYVWKWMYDPSFGVINSAISVLGFDGPNWLADGRVALASLVIVNVWKWLGYFMIVIVANLQLIDDELYEAASIDGAGPLRQFTAITIPLLREAIGLCVVLGIINFMSTFAIVFVMTGGGPGGKTDMIAPFVYNEAFGTGLLRIGFGAAASMIFLGAMLGLTFGTRRLFGTGR